MTATISQPIIKRLLRGGRGPAGIGCLLESRDKGIDGSTGMKGLEVVGVFVIVEHQIWRHLRRMLDENVVLTIPLRLIHVGYSVAAVWGCRVDYAASLGCLRGRPRGLGSVAGSSAMRSA